MSTYLITGGCGFLGSNIAARLIRSGERVVVFDNLYRLGADKNLAWLRTLGAFEFVHGDTRFAYDVDGVVSACAPEVIFHLAGQVAMTTSLKSPRLDFDINAAGTMNVLEAARRHAPHAIVVYSSTNKVYGDLETLACRETATRYELEAYPYGLPETMPLDFHSPYGCSKGAADQYMLDYHRMFGLNTVVFRHSSMYGGRQFSTYDQGWIGWFCRQAWLQQQGKGEVFTVSGNGKQVRDALHADDMVDLYLQAVARIEHCKGQAFNIGGGRENSLSILELLHFLGRELSVRLAVRHIAPRESDQKVFVADIRKAGTCLGWQPQVNWQAGLRKMLAWVKDFDMENG
jgi:CDP-paratose 2-epimerase